MPDLQSQWEGTPIFVHGQVMSAEAHLNLLARAVQSLRDSQVGYHNVFSGWSSAYAQETDSYAGYIRHKVNSFDYYLQISSGTWTLKINGVAAHADVTNLTAGTYQGTIDITALGLTVDEFYPVTFTRAAAGYAIVWLLRESKPLAALTALDENIWLDDNVPTAGEWQSLSYLADELHLRLDTAHALAGSLVTPDNSPATNYDNCYIASCTHKVRYLHYRIKVWEPYWCTQHDTDPHRWDCIWNMTPGYGECYPPGTAGSGIDNPACVGDDWGIAHLYINGVERLTMGVGDGYAYGGDHEWEGDLDIDALGIARGEDYYISISYESSTTWDWYNRVAVRYLMEAPVADEPLAGWHDLDIWDYGDYVNGDTGPKPTQYFASDLNLLLTAGVQTNYPCKRNWFGGIEYFADSEQLWGGVTWDDSTADHRFWTIRVHRYLHYYVPAAADESTIDSPHLIYEYEDKVGAKAAVVELELSQGVWKTYDLDEAEGLFPGTLYWLEGVQYAIEDVT